jgi:Zn-dependent peptidase ImmA (M78 family)
MDYRNVKVPFLKNIRERADRFRKRVWGDSIPINMEEIIELKLRIGLMPLYGLQKSFGVDAFITSDWSLIYVDEDEYKIFPSRLKFSLAHEIGHFILHKNIYTSFRIKTIEDLQRFIEQIPQEQHNNFETQANIFANNLLAPRDRLIIEREKALKIIRNKFVQIEKVNKSILNPYLAIPISKKFEVSEKVAQIALGNLNN